MEKPTIAGNTMPGYEDLMSLVELAGLLSMQLTDALAGSRSPFVEWKSCNRSDGKTEKCSECVLAYLNMNIMYIIMCHNLHHKVQTPAKTLVLLAAVGSWIPAQSILVMAGTCRILVAALDLVVTNASQFVPLPQVSSPATVTDVSFGMWSSSQLSSNRQPFFVPVDPRSWWYLATECLLSLSLRNVSLFSRNFSSKNLRECANWYQNL